MTFHKNVYLIIQRLTLDRGIMGKAMGLTISTKEYEKPREKEPPNK